MRLYDSAEQAVRDFTPLNPGKVSMYVCGPTVQSSPHVGHLRSALVYDVLRRWLSYEGAHVTLIRNVTDIDDKVLANAAAGKQEQWFELAYRTETEFTECYDVLGILRPSYEPRATAHIPEMIALISRLISAGHAYIADDGSADVYFDTSSWAEYGSLTRQKIADMEGEADLTEGELTDGPSAASAHAKRNSTDFALWKSAKADEPVTAQWQTPWGIGRPGWHIECSAMAERYLGPQFDIHGGGLDLRFPHHENERAQSNAAGSPFANYWLHNGLVHVNGQKMSKSLGNSVFASDLLSEAKPIVIRFMLSAAQYRSTLDLHEGAVSEAVATFDRIETFLARAERSGALNEAAVDVPAGFRDAMNDDLNTPQALAVLFEEVRAGNAAFDADDQAGGAQSATRVVAMLDVLGLNPRHEHWASGAHSASNQALASLMEQLLASRDQARAEKDFAVADRIRDSIAAAGITLEDTPQGTHWSTDG